jgi:hypothetical protein
VSIGWRTFKEKVVSMHKITRSSTIQKGFIEVAKEIARETQPSRSKGRVTRKELDT